jgi:hypothetical protein
MASPWFILLVVFSASFATPAFVTTLDIFTSQKKISGFNSAMGLDLFLFSVSYEMAVAK